MPSKLPSRCATIERDRTHDGRDIIILRFRNFPGRPDDVAVRLSLQDAESVAEQIIEAVRDAEENAVTVIIKKEKRR